MTRQLRTSPTLCADADFDALTTLSSASRVGYDGQPYGTALAASTRALVTGSWSLKADGSGFQSDGTVAFDALGRVVSRTDPDGRTSTTTFEPATGQAYEVVERNSLGHEQTVEVDPGRGVAVRSTDPNGHVSQSTYDPLGRLVEVWAPGRTPTAGAVPDFSAEYHLPAGKPPYVVTRSRGHENRVETAVTLYDGLGRERQSQQEAVGGGRLISDTLYNTSGEVWQTNNAYYAEGAPSGGLFTPLADTAVPNATRYTYDGLGRVVTEMPVLRGTEAPERATRYRNAGQCSGLQAGGEGPRWEGPPGPEQCSNLAGFPARCTASRCSVARRRRSRRSTSPTRACWPGRSGVRGRETPAAGGATRRP